MSSFISGNKNLARRFSPTPPLRYDFASSSKSPMVIIEEISEEQEVGIEASTQEEASKPQSEERENK
ncbi:unnamed protein product [Cochlearia groenlandica]